MNAIPILARLSRSAKLVGQAARSLISDGAATPAAVGDFQTGAFFVQRRMTPEQVRLTLERAAMGDLAAQWDLFALMEDTWPRLAKNLGELRRAAARANYSVQPYAERGTEPTDTAKARAALVDQALRQWWPKPGTLELSFEDTLFHALDAYGKGVSALEIHWQTTAAGIVPRCSHVLAPARYGWNDKGTELGLLGVGGLAWQEFPQDHFLVGIWQARTGAPGATAVLRALAPYWAGVTFGWEWLLSNAQIFGVPFRWASFDKNQPGLGLQLRDMLAAMGSCGYGAFPEGTKLEFKEVSQNVTGNPQVVIQEMADKACDLLILGQELSGAAQKAGLGGGAANLQQSVRADRLEAAAQWCADLLNYQLVPGLLRANFGDTAEPPAIAPDVEDDPKPLEMAQRDQVFLNAGIDLPRGWFYQRHKIPAPVEGEAVITGRAPTPAIAPGAAPAEPVTARHRLLLQAADAGDAMGEAFRRAALTEIGKAELRSRQPILARLAQLKDAPDAAAYAAALRKLHGDLPALGFGADSELARTINQALAPAAASGVAAAATLQK